MHQQGPPSNRPSMHPAGGAHPTTGVPSGGVAHPSQPTTLHPPQPRAVGMPQPAAPGGLRAGGHVVQPGGIRPPQAIAPQQQGGLRPSGSVSAAAANHATPTHIAGGHPAGGHHATHHHAAHDPMAATVCETAEDYDRPTVHSTKYGETVDDTLELVETAPVEAEPAKKIIKFDHDGIQRKEDFKRKPNKNGTGATHVRTFHGKYSEEGLKYMDNSINDWLDAHPDIEVKFVTSTVALFQGKLAETQLVLNIWY